MYRFQVIEMSCPATGLDDRPLYGILAEEKSSGGWAAVTVAANLSFDKNFVAGLAGKCTRLQLDPIHLADVVEDAFYNIRTQNQSPISVPDGPAGSG